MITLGIYAWGTVTIVLSATVLFGVFFGNPTRIGGLYLRIKDCASVLGPIIAASVLAWSWFYQTAYPKTDKIPATSGLTEPAIQK